MEKQTEGAPDSGRAAWNINGQYAQLIAREMESAQKCYNNGDYVQYFKILDGVCELATHSLDDNIIKKMQKKRFNVIKNEKYFRRCSFLKSEGLSSKITLEERKGAWRYVEYIRFYKRALLKILKQCGYLTNTALRSHLKL